MMLIFAAGIFFGLPFFLRGMGSVPSMKAPHPEPLKSCGICTFSLRSPLAFTLTLSRLAGGVHAPVGSFWLMQRATENLHALSPATPWSQAEPSVQRSVLLLVTWL